MIDKNNLKIEGHLLIKDKNTNEIIVDKNNAIHFENMSISLAKSLSHRPDGHIHEMHFGNGGSSVSAIGAITYLPPNIAGANADLYNSTFFKVIDDQSPLNNDPENNFLNVQHTTNSLFSDIVITATLDAKEPNGQEAFDDAINLEGDFIFDEIGLKTFTETPGVGPLITHVIFNPVQKSLNRIFEIVYTIRISMV